MAALPNCALCEHCNIKKQICKYHPEGITGEIMLASDDCEWFKEIPSLFPDEEPLHIVNGR